MYKSSYYNKIFLNDIVFFHSSSNKIWYIEPNYPLLQDQMFAHYCKNKMDFICQLKAMPAMWKNNINLNYNETSYFCSLQ